MTMTIQILLGIVLALPFVMLAGRSYQPTHMLATGLLLAALIYVGFAVFGGAESSWIGVELSGVLFYGFFAWLGLKQSIYWLSAGWGLHLLWDVGLHQFTTGSVYTPSWYPPVCIGFDLAVAALILAVMYGWNGFGLSRKTFNRAQD